MDIDGSLRCNYYVARSCNYKILCTLGYLKAFIWLYVLLVISYDLIMWIN